MKNLIRIASLVLVVAMVAVLFTSCGNTLKGTYKSEEVFGSYVEYSFETDGSVTVKGSAFGLGAEIEGTYELGKNEEGESIITFTFGEEGTKYAGEHSFLKGKDSNKGDYIEIDGVKYFKQD